MKLIINIGMHKTGSSSIQNSFSKFKTRDACYLPIGNPNHSAAYSTMFSAAPENYLAHRKNKREPEDVFRLREDFFRNIEKFLAGTKSKKILSSAEDVTLLSEEELGTMKQWLERNIDDVLIVGYVRPPASFMSSAIQQRIAGGITWKARSLYPNYRSRFEKFDKVFGKENVMLVKFDRQNLRNGDVVLDFAHRAGVEIDPADVQYANESRGLEATSIVAAQRLLGRGFVHYHRSPIHNNRMVTALRSIGNSKIVLHSDMIAPVLQENADDLAWITERLGVDFADATSDAPNAIRSNDDFLEIASGHLTGVLEKIIELTDGEKTDPQIVARAVDLLLDVIKEKDMDRRQQNAERREKREKRGKR